MRVNRIAAQALAGMALLAVAGSAQSFITSTTFNFNTMAEPTGSHGESAWTSLDLAGTGFNVAITGTKFRPTDPTNTSAFAYLDASNAGLGVCGSASGAINQTTGSGANLCSPSSDDNTTVGETLHFTFDADVTIDNFWFNNNHDGGFGTNPQDQVNIGGTAFDVVTGVAGEVGTGIGSFTVLAGNTLTVGYENEQFYVSAMTISVDIPPPASVPEPATLLLLALGLIGISLSAKKKPATVSVDRS